jgi:hypothetical protein
MTSAVMSRWPAVAATLASAPPPVNLRLVQGRGTREETLSFDGIQLTSAHDRLAEAQLQAARVPLDATEATLYGVGLGDVARVLLARPALERLTVVILSPMVARESFVRFPSDDWLDDPRVELTLASPDDRLVRPYAVVAPCLRLAEPPAFPLRDALVRELNEPYTAGRWLLRRKELTDRVIHLSRRFTGDADVATAFGTLAGHTVYVCGGGPTLSTAFEEIRHRQEAGEARVTVVAVTTALQPLSRANVTADYAVVLDPEVTVALHLTGVPPGSLAATTLLYAGYADEELVASWPGRRRLVFHIEHPFFDAAPAPRTRLFAGGTVVHPALDFAVRAGAAEVVLCGLDFAYVGSRTHAVGAHDHKAVAGIRAARLSVENGHGALVASDTNLIQYLRATERFVARHPEVLFRNVSREGARIRGVVLP